MEMQPSASHLPAFFRCFLLLRVAGDTKICDSSMKPFSISILAIAAVLAALPLQVGAAMKGVEYNRDIRPILADNCFSCHGADSASRKAGLRLDHFTLIDLAWNDGGIAALV